MSAKSDNPGDVNFFKEDNMVKPITPDSVVEKKEQIMPDFVIEAFNTIIAKNYSSGYARFDKDEAIEAIIKASGNEATRSRIFDEKWLDVEDIYRQAGWKVSYDDYYIFKRS
jgi:hypothetical protein